MVVSDWMLPKLTDYWDFNVRALQTGAQRLAQVPEDEWPEAEAAIQEAIIDHVSVIGDDLLRRAAVSFVDDLYKEASASTTWGGALPAFLHTCAGTLSKCLGERGIRLQYLIDNEFSDMSRPLELFPEWFEACGFVYACPQAIVPGLAEQDGVADLEFAEQCRRYAGEARHVVNAIVERCQAEGRHFVQLDTDSTSGSYDVAMGAVRTPGVITVSRAEAPIPGSHVDVWIADEMQ